MVVGPTGAATVMGEDVSCIAASISISLSQQMFFMQASLSAPEVAIQVVGADVYPPRFKSLHATSPSHNVMVHHAWTYAELELWTYDGVAELRNVQGGSVSAYSETGEVKAINATAVQLVPLQGGPMRLGTSSGTVYLHDIVVGESVNVTAQSGDVVADNVAALFLDSFRVSSHSGTVYCYYFASAAGPEMTFSTVSGELKLTVVYGNRVNLEAGDGSSVHVYDMLLGVEPVAVKGIKIDKYPEPGLQLVATTGSVDLDGVGGTNANFSTRLDIDVSSTSGSVELQLIEGAFFGGFELASATGSVVAVVGDDILDSPVRQMTGRVSATGNSFVSVRSHSGNVELSAPVLPI